MSSRNRPYFELNEFSNSPMERYRIALHRWFSYSPLEGGASFGRLSIPCSNLQEGFERERERD